MSSKQTAIYQQVFDDMRRSGLLDSLKEEIRAGSKNFGDKYCYSWAQHFNLWRPLHSAYRTRTKLYSIPLPSMKKFRQLVETYCL